MREATDDQPRKGTPAPRNEYVARLNCRRQGTAWAMQLATERLKRALTGAAANDRHKKGNTMRAIDTFTVVA